MFNVTGAEQSEDGRETPRSPTLMSSNSNVTERSSTSSDSATVCSWTNTDHAVNDRHSADELTSKTSLPNDMIESSIWLFCMLLGSLWQLLPWIIIMLSIVHCTAVSACSVQDVINVVITVTAAVPQWVG